jgi:hypothetical protein
MNRYESPGCLHDEKFQPKLTFVLIPVGNCIQILWANWMPPEKTVPARFPQRRGTALSTDNNTPFFQWRAWWVKCFIGKCRRNLSGIPNDESQRNHNWFSLPGQQFHRSLLVTCLFSVESWRKLPDISCIVPVSLQAWFDESKHLILSLRF